MRIAFITTHLTFIGGVGRVIMDYANKFSEKDHKIIVIAQKIDRKKYKFKDNVSLIEIGGPLPSNFLYWIGFKIIKKKYLKVLNKIDAEIYFSHLFPSNYFASLINKNSNYKHVYYCYEPFRYFYDKTFYSKLPLLKKFENWILKLIFKKYDIKGSINANKIICISNFIKEKILKIYKKDAQVYYPIILMDESENHSNLNIRKRYDLKESTPILFALGLTHHMKGADKLIIIFKKILNEIPNAVLLIGGRISKENQTLIHKYIKTLTLPKNKIIQCGLIEDNDLKYFYKVSNSTLYTAIDESFGLIPLESMKYGTPVIAFEGGPSELIKNGKTGYVIKKNNIDDFAKKAIVLIKDDNLHTKMSKNAINHVKENFNFKKSVIDLELLFQKVYTDEL